MTSVSARLAVAVLALVVLSCGGGATQRALSGVEPAVVDPGFLAPCPDGPCTEAAAGPCHTVVVVRVGEDLYIDYELSGGP